MWLNRCTRVAMLLAVVCGALGRATAGGPPEAAGETIRSGLAAGPSLSSRDRWKRMKYGFFVHYVWDGGQEATTIRPDGSRPTTIDELADGFDVPGFVRDLRAMEVEYLIFTAWHSHNFPLYPSAVADRIAGFQRSPRRDLLGELIDACRAVGISVVLYAHPEQAIDWQGDWIADQAAGYAELIERYGSRIDGIFMDENSPEGMMKPDGGRFQNLERIIHGRHPDLVVMQNYFGNLYATDQVMLERGGTPGAEAMTWGYASRVPIAHTIAGSWMARKPNTERAMLYTGEGIFRFTVMMAGACTEGGGMAWAAGPYVGGGWEGGVLEEMTKAGRLIASVAESIKGTFPSRSYPTLPGTAIGELAWGVATRAADGATEYLHVLRPPTERTLALPQPADGAVFANARLVPSGRPVGLAASHAGLRLTLPEGAAWDPLDTVIAMDVRCPGGRSLINDDDPAIEYTGGSWQRVGYRNLGEYGNDVHLATADGDSLSLSFEGTDVSVIASRGVDRGMVDFLIDDVLRQTVDLAADPSPRTVVFEVSGLGNGVHTLTVVKRGGGQMAIDAFQVSELLNDDDPRIRYLPPAGDAAGPAWERRALPRLGCVNDDVHAATALGGVMELEFEGTGLDLMAPPSTQLGTVVSTIDDGPATVSNHYAGLPAVSRVMFSTRDEAPLPPGGHRFRMVLHRGERMQVDAVRIYKRPRAR